MSVRMINAQRSHRVWLLVLQILENVLLIRGWDPCPAVHPPTHFMGCSRHTHPRESESSSSPPPALVLYRRTVFVLVGKNYRIQCNRCLKIAAIRQRSPLQPESPGGPIDSTKNKQAWKIEKSLADPGAEGESGKIEKGDTRKLGRHQCIHHRPLIWQIFISLKPYFPIHM